MSNRRHSRFQWFTLTLSLRFGLAPASNKYRTSWTWRNSAAQIIGDHPPSSYKVTQDNNSVSSKTAEPTSVLRKSFRRDQIIFCTNHTILNINIGSKHFTQNIMVHTLMLTSIRWVSTRYLTTSSLPVWAAKCKQVIPSSAWKKKQTKLKTIGPTQT